MGEEYPDTTSVGDLASSLVRQGKSVEAEEMLQASLVARRRVLGNAHPHHRSSLHRGWRSFWKFRFEAYFL
jgi:hypothetical protein